MELVKLGLKDKDIVKRFFRDVFTEKPWNDDWSDEEQLDRYIVDLIGNENSLTLAFMEGDKLAALAMGHIRHWFEATEYFVDELCVKTELQGQGIGGRFVSAVEEFLKTNGIGAIFLLTERDVGAYKFYKKCGFKECENNVAFAKVIR